MNISPLNVIVAGLGGQGVYTLTQLIWKLCELNRFKIQGAIFKGGAQKHGSIYSIIRIFTDNLTDYDRYATQIPEGELDLMIGLEVWETLRYKRYFGPRTKIFLNEKIIPFRIERIELSDKKPLAAILGLNLDILMKNYAKESERLFGTDKMVNILIALEVFKSGAIEVDLTRLEGVIDELIMLDQKTKIILNELIRRG